MMFETACFKTPDPCALFQSALTRNSGMARNVGKSLERRTRNLALISDGGA